MALSDEQTVGLIENVTSLINTIATLQQKIIDLNQKIKSVSELTLNLIEHTNMPEPQIMPCDPDDGSWVGR